MTSSSIITLSTDLHLLVQMLVRSCWLWSLTEIRRENQQTVRTVTFLQDRIERTVGKTNKRKKATQRMVQSSEKKETNQNSVEEKVLDSQHLSTGSILYVSVSCWSQMVLFVSWNACIQGLGIAYVLLKTTGNISSKHEFTQWRSYSPYQDF